MDRLGQLEVFTRIAEAGNLTRAAETLGLSVSSVSRQLHALESRLGVRLVQRTTRQLVLTQEGAAYAQTLRELLGSLSDLESGISSAMAEPCGRLRIGASQSFATLHLMPVVTAYRRRYPKVQIEILSSNRYHDIIEDGLDLAIRTRRAETDSSITIRRLAETRRLLAASPDYLRARGTPRHPDELAGHDLLLYTLSENWQELTFSRPEGRVTVQVSPALSANDHQLLCQAARDGSGIVVQPAYVLQDDLQAGRLVCLLDDWDLPRLTINLAFPTRMHLPARTRLFIDMLTARFQGRELERDWTACPATAPCPAEIG